MIEKHYISHKLEEVSELCEWVTILRDGKIIDSKGLSGFTKDEIIAKMIGREITNKFPKRVFKPKEKEILRVEGLSRKRILDNVSFSLREGEILGLAGLVGARRAEIARAVTGIDYIDGGDVYVEGRIRFSLIFLPTWWKG